MGYCTSLNVASKDFVAQREERFASTGVSGTQRFSSRAATTGVRSERRSEPEDQKDICLAIGTRGTWFAFAPSIALRFGVRGTWHGWGDMIFPCQSMARRRGTVAIRADLLTQFVNTPQNPAVHKGQSNLQCFGAEARHGTQGSLGSELYETFDISIYPEEKTSLILLQAPWMSTAALACWRFTLDCIALWLTKADQVCIFPSRRVNLCSVP